MAKKNRRASQSGKRVGKKISAKGGRGSSRMSGRKPKSASKKGTVAKTGSEVSRLLESLNWTHAMTAQMANSVPPDKATWQASPTDNHVLWTLGHMATAYSWFASLIDGKGAELPADYDKLFAFKSVPVNDPSVYPSADSVRQLHEAAYRRMTEAIQGLSDAESLKPPTSDTGGFVKSKLDAIHKAIWHESWHQGQLSTLRRAMGLPGVM